MHSEDTPDIAITDKNNKQKVAFIQLHDTYDMCNMQSHELIETVIKIITITIIIISSVQIVCMCPIL